MGLGDGIARALVTTKARRDTVPAGTREVAVTLTALGRARMRVFDRGIALVTTEYKQKWNEDVPWDMASIHFHFASITCTVVLEVRP